MAANDSTPVRELSDADLRLGLLALGYDIPVSVNREFLVRKLENASGGGGGGSAKGKKQRHSMAAFPPATNSPSHASSSGTGSPSTARKRKSLATPLTTPPMSNNAIRGHHNNVSASTPLSPLATSSPLLPGTPQQQYMGSPASSISMNTPSTPPLSPFISRLSTPSPSSSPQMNNGETGGNHSPRYLNYYNMFKASSSGSSGSSEGEVGSYGYPSPYNRGGMRIAPPGNFSPVTSVAPPSSRSAERNGYTTGGPASGTGLGIESDWCGGHLISKILVIFFFLFFLIIGGLYISKNMAVDPRGLTATSDSKGDGVFKESPPAVTPPPAKKKVEVPPPLTSMVFPICGLKGVDPEACIPKDVVKNSRTLFNTLKEELTQRARKIGCHSDIKEETVSLQDAKSVLYRLADLRKQEVDSAFRGMLLLVTENPRGGLSLHAAQEEMEILSKDVANLDFVVTKISATGVNPDFICEMKAMFFSLTLYLTVAVALVGGGFIGWKGYKMYRAKKESEQDEIYRMVERILDLLQRQFELSENSQGTPFLAVNHVRDELVPPKERVKKEAFWNKVVKHISTSESRVREEIQHISGEEFKVWRWLPSASPLVSKKRFSTAHSLLQRSHFSMPGSPPLMLFRSANSSSAAVAGPSHGSMSPPLPPQQHNLYPSLSGLSTNGAGDDDDETGGGNGDTIANNKWQGQAFETCEGSPNALPTTPTTCLKIRHMFTERDGVKERSRIEQHILEKCSQAKILHIGMDANSVEGCVYIRCSTKEDARVAFLALHGWWFEGKLLSVKFLREERYFNRFPEARNSTVPMRLSR